MTGTAHALRAAAAAAAAVVALTGCGSDDPPPATTDGPAENESDATGPSDGCGAGTDVRPGTTRASVATSGRERDYLLSVPTAHDGERPLPLLLNFHGLTSGAQDQTDYTALDDLGEETGVVVVAPEGGGFPSRWRLPGSDGAEDDVAFVVDLLDHLGARLCLDQDRTFVAGISNGAAFASVLACELSGRVAGVAAVAGVNLVGACPDGEPVPLLAFHGTEDRIVPFEGGSLLFGLAAARPVEDAVADWAARNGCDPTPLVDPVGDEVERRRYEGCSAPVELYVVEGGGHTWPGAERVRGLGSVTDEVDASRLVVEMVSGAGRG